MRALAAIFLIFNLAFCEANSTLSTAHTRLESNASSAASEKKDEDSKLSASLKDQIRVIDDEIKNNIWISRFSNFIGYQNLQKQSSQLEAELKKSAGTDKIAEIQKRLRAVKEQLILLKEYEKSPFLDIIAMPETPEPARITNPFSIISGFSTIRNLQAQKVEQKNAIENIKALIDKLEAKRALYERLMQIDTDASAAAELKSLDYELSEFSSASSWLDCFCKF